MNTDNNLNAKSEEMKNLDIYRGITVNICLGGTL